MSEPESPRAPEPTADPDLPLVVVSDFNETLVRERTLPRFCRDRLRRNGIFREPGFAARVALYGPLALLFDLLGAPRLSARLGFRVFRGMRRMELEQWARAGLTPNESAFTALEQLAPSAPFIVLHVVSRGSPTCVIRAFLSRDDVWERLRKLRVVVARETIAAELEARAGELTGRVQSAPLAKQARAALIPDGAVFLGDHRDARWVRRLTGRHFQFLRV